MSEVICDNDVVLKCCCFDLSAEALVSLNAIGSVSVLGAARYVIRSQISRSKQILNRNVASENFDLFVGSVREIEPTDAEIKLAAEFESDSQKLNLALDGGESILLSVLLSRESKVLLTGDKRAIFSIEQLRAVNSKIAAIASKVGCLEQLISSILLQSDVSCVQERVCSEPLADSAIAICFACRSGIFTKESISDDLNVGLSSK